MRETQQLKELLPPWLRHYLSDSRILDLQEIRLRCGAPVQFLRAGGEELLMRIVTQKDLEEVLTSVCRQSAYAHREEIRQGYITTEGGHRIGICGAGVMEEGKVLTIRSLFSLNIRVARQVPGFAAVLEPWLDGSTLILGPPGSGKTTLLRDAVRCLSDHLGKQVSLADQRGEVSAPKDGIPQLDVGRRTDVLSGVDKAQAVMMLLRTMGPQWLAMDEITAPEDIAALEQAAYCGVQLLATAHGEGGEDMQRRPLYAELLRRRIFRQLVCLRPDRYYEIERLE